MDVEGEEEEEQAPFMVPVAPAPPPPYTLTGFEEQVDDYLTSDSLQRVTLQKAPPQPPAIRELDALSQLELAVRRRAERKIDAGVLEQAKACVERVDNIRFEKTLLAQAQVVQEARRVEQLLDQQGGAEALRAANWPSFDVTTLDAMLKRDLEVHGTIVAAKRVLAEQRADQVEQLLNHMQQVQKSLDYLRVTNTERFQLRLRVDPQQEAKTKYSILLLQLLFESGFKSDEQLKASRSKFGAQFQSQKALSFLKAAVQMSKKLNALIKGASENEKLLIEQMLKRALELLDGKPLTRSSSSSSLVLVKPEQVPELSEEEANDLMATATGKVLEALLRRPDVRVATVSNSTGATPLHSAASLEGLLLMLEMPDAVKALTVKARDSLDTPLHSLCKRAQLFRREGPRLAEAVTRLVSMGSEAVGEDDALGRKPLASLALKLARGGDAAAASAATAAGGGGGAGPGVSSFERFLFSPSLSDVSFALDNGAVVPAHRIILCSGSSVLRAMLEESQFAESTSNRISLPDVDEETLRFVFRYLYAGPSAAQLQLNQEPLGLLAMRLADRWLVGELVRLLARRFLGLLSRENCFMIVQETEHLVQSDTVRTLRRAAAAMVLNEYHVLEPYDDAERSRLREALVLLCCQE
jgi:hypothetical protein